MCRKEATVTRFGRKASPKGRVDNDTDSSKDPKAHLSETWSNSTMTEIQAIAELPKTRSERIVLIGSPLA
ncbi:hypothetical protein D3C86_2107610 [compost metagenome]